MSEYRVSVCDFCGEEQRVQPGVKPDDHRVVCWDLACSQEPKIKFTACKPCRDYLAKCVEALKNGTLRALVTAGPVVHMQPGKTLQPDGVSLITAERAKDDMAAFENALPLIQMLVNREVDDRIPFLVQAGALIATEIDRMLRAKAKGAKSE